MKLRNAVKLRCRAAPTILALLSCAACTPPGVPPAERSSAPRHDAEAGITPRPEDASAPGPQEGISDASTEPRDATAPRPPLRASGSYQGHEFHAGDRVRIQARQGTLQRAITGHEKDVAYGAGQIGVLRGVYTKSVPSASGSPWHVEVGVVAWDAQKWCEFTPPWDRMVQGRPYSGDELARMNEECEKVVSLGAFEADIGLSYIAVTGGGHDAGRPAGRAM